MVLLRVNIAAYHLFNYYQGNKINRLPIKMY